MNAPSICMGNGTCDSRTPHICYNGKDVADMDAPWAVTATVESRSSADAQKAGNVYTARPVCECGYKGRWTKEAHALGLAAAHVCFS